MGVPERVMNPGAVVAMTDIQPPAEAIRAAAIETLHDAAADASLSQRLGVVGASVAIELGDRPDTTFVVRFADGSVAVHEGDDPRADIRLEMTHTDLHELFSGGLHLPMKIARGQVGYSGQVRRFLRITAILADMGEAYAVRLREARAEGAR